MNYEGIRFKTCRDKTTGLIACPICIHAASKCLGERPPSNYEYENTFFYSVEDLIEHLKGYHIHGLKKKIMKLLSKKTEGEE
ncbi:MAG: hypothetical protein QW764_00965 [Desulfurococcaceae archaeon]